MTLSDPVAARPLRALVVDDEPHISRIIRTRLEQGPFEVIAVESGVAALDVLATTHIDLLVLDIMLPGMSGLEVLETVRADARWRALPCIVLTAAGQDTHFKTAHDLGASEFMTKPFSPRRLLEKALHLVGYAAR